MVLRGSWVIESGKADEPEMGRVCFVFFRK